MSSGEGLGREMVKTTGAWDPLQAYGIRTDGDEAQAYALLTSIQNGSDVH